MSNERESLKDKDLVLSIAKIALDKQAIAVEIIDVSDKVDYAEYLLVCSGRSERQVRAIAESIEVGLKARKIMALGVEGLRQGEWVLIDYGGVIVHVLNENKRDYYDLEGLWMDARRLPVPEEAEHSTPDKGDPSSPPAL